MPPLSILLALALMLSLGSPGDASAQLAISEEEAEKRAEWRQEAMELEAEVPVARNLLRAGDSTTALPITERLVERLAPGVVKEERASYDLLAYLHTLHALALVGEGREEDAAWHRSLAVSLSSRVAEASLEAYGDLGERLGALDIPCRSMDAPREENGPGDPGEPPEYVAEAEAMDAAADSRPLQVSGDVLGPKRLSVRPPQYTDPGRWARAEGVAIVQAVIDEAGRVDSVCVLHSENPMFAQQGATAIRDWTFEPATLEGEPVPVYYNLTVNFTLH